MAAPGIIRNITVVGLGGVGGVIGSRLARLPRNLTFIARGPHLAAIRSGGLRVLQPDGSEFTVRPDLATDRFEETPPPDLVVLCVKSYGLEEAAGRLAPLVRNSTVVLSLLNGADIRERLRARLRGGIVPPACIYLSARRGKPGTVHHVGGAGLIHLGPDPDRPDWDGRELCDVLNEAGIPFQWHEDPTAAIWTKYAFIASMALVTAAHGVDFGQVLSTPALAAQARGVIEEIRRIAAAEGATLPEDLAEATLRSAASFPMETRTSYQRDLENHAPANEGDLFAGTILRLGARHGVPTPLSAELAAAIARRPA